MPGMEGWLFDVYPSSEGMVVWVQGTDGRPHRLLAPYRPGMFIAGPRRAIEQAECALRPLGVPVGIRPAVQRELMSGEEVPVFRVSVGSPAAFPAAARRLAAVPGLTLYNCDIPVGRLFFYELGLFPLARCRIEAEEEIARRIEPLSRPEDLEYDLPPLTTLRVRLVPYTHGDATISPAHGRRGLLEAGVDGETVVVDGDDTAQVIRSLNRLLTRYDPDVVLTEWGDAFLLPRLRALAARSGIPLRLNRDPHEAVRSRRARSYVTYGQVVYQAGAQMLYGRWHIDLRNSFIYSEGELAGLLEVARLSGIPVQDQARTSTGTAISSMQFAQAVRDGVLIPWQKSEPEEFKTAAQLIVTDKGGLTYQPVVGLYEEVGELDFSSMYPTLMSTFNISPETIGCACCPDSRVPEIHYSVCRRRRGLVPRVLDHLLERRLYYKRRRNETTGAARDLYQQRQTALKWCLVTCLDGETLVLHRRAQRWKIARIQDIVDEFLPGEQWGVLPVTDLTVMGIDTHLRNTPKAVGQVLKAPAPSKMLQITMQWGRQMRLVPDHRCYTLEHGRLVVKQADELKVGDWIPLVGSLEETVGEPQTQINLLTALQRTLSEHEQRVWRVFGPPVRRLAAASYEALRRRSAGVYVPKTVWNWREYGYLPLDLVDPEEFTTPERSCLWVGRGKREGGIIRRIPALMDVDEDLGFLLGFFVGDGSVSGKMIRFAVGATEPDHLDRLAGILGRKFGLRARAYRERKARMYVLQVNSVALIQIFERVLGIGGTADRGKLHVPEIVLNGTREVQRGFLLGMLASDGSVSRTRNFLDIASADARFIGELSWLFTLLGIEYRQTRRGRLHHLQTRNLQEMEKLLHAGAYASDKHRERWLLRRTAAQSMRLAQIPSVASGLLELCRAGRTARLPRVSGVIAVSRATAKMKLEQLRQRTHRFSHGLHETLHHLNTVVESSLVFAQIVAIDEIPSSADFVYCVRLAEEPAAFYIEGGILTHNSFGYLGYRNARFGRIEAHEAVTAFSREMLLRAKELAEARGYRMLHALVDSMWLQRPGATRAAYEALAAEITAATALPIFVEGVYRWLGFLPSRTHPGVGVPNRYLGVFEDGATKVRGIEVRRSDVPAIVETTQRAMLARMFACPDLAAVRAALPEILGIVEQALVRLRAGEVTPEELVITTHLSQEVGAYRHNTVQAITARALDRHGARLHPGEAIQYVITDRAAPLPEDRVRPYTLLGGDWVYDVEAYAAMVIRAAATVLELLGYTEARLRREIWEVAVRGR